MRTQDKITIKAATVTVALGVLTSIAWAESIKLTAKPATLSDEQMNTITGGQGQEFAGQGNYTAYLRNAPVIEKIGTVNGTAELPVWSPASNDSAPTDSSPGVYVGSGFHTADPSTNPSKNHSYGNLSPGLR